MSLIGHVSDNLTKRNIHSISKLNLQRTSHWYLQINFVDVRYHQTMLIGFSKLVY